MERVVVADLMTRTPVIVKPEENLLACAKKMIKKKVHSLLLVEKKKLTGIISQKDILWALTKKPQKELSTIKAMDISPKKIITLKPQLSVRDTIARMKKTKLDKFPVIDNGILVGMITAKDILNFHPEFYPEIDEFAKIKEESKKLKRVKKAQEIAEGICEECGNQDILEEFNGMVICESCKTSM